MLIKKRKRKQSVSVATFCHNSWQENHQYTNTIIQYQKKEIKKEKKDNVTTYKSIYDGFPVNSSRSHGTCCSLPWSLDSKLSIQTVQRSWWWWWIVVVGSWHVWYQRFWCCNLLSLSFSLISDLPFSLSISLFPPLDLSLSISLSLSPPFSFLVSQIYRVGVGFQFFFFPSINVFPKIKK